MLLENKGKMANVNHIINPNQVLRDLGLDVPTVKAYVVREPIAWRSSIKGDVKSVQLDSGSNFVDQIVVHVIDGNRRVDAVSKELDDQVMLQVDAANLRENSKGRVCELYFSEF
ncbi:hypothetical protein LV160_009097 [Aspergillus fumigatus]|nr:hypothetical protein LV160_009097 [Aspergillus fumigatus]